MLWLTPEAERELIETIATSFTPEDLDFKIADPLRIPPNARSEARDHRTRVGALVKWAEREDRLLELLATALQGNPSNSALRRLNELHGLLPPSGSLFELVNNEVAPEGRDAWLRRMTETQRQVCEIANEDSGGMGFLVGLDLVMTCAPVAGSRLQQARFTFEGATYSSHPTVPVLVSVPNSVCIVRLDRPAAREVSHTEANVAVRSRGWVLPVFAEPVSGSALAIVQFFDGAPRISLDPHGFLETSGDHVYYTTTTRYGSMGAPCYDSQWRFVGMHIGRGGRESNHGLSAAAILRDLKSAGFEWDLSYGIQQVDGGKVEVQIERNTAELDARIGGIAATIDEEAWSADVEELDLPLDERWAWAEAAAVHATFDPDSLKPFGEASANARVALLLESRKVGDTWVIGDGLRKGALKRLAERGDLRAARARNLADGNDPVDVALGRLINGDGFQTTDLGDPNAMRALLTAADWLDGVVPDLPDRSFVLTCMERATLLAPFRHLTRGFFAGRDSELARLKAYVDDLASRPPLFIHAAGGMGKSALLAHFVLTNSRLDPTKPDEWRPFLYLDFDRPELDATEMAGLLIAMARQIGVQVPSITKEAQGLVERDAERRRNQRRSYRRPRRKRQNLASQLAPDGSREVQVLVGDLMAKLPGSTPILLILDTLEEVQFASPDAIPPLVELVTQLQQRVPQLRPILAGRVSADADIEPMELIGLPDSAAEALLTNELPPAIAADTTLVKRIARICSGNPLSLRLAAELVRREEGNAARAIKDLHEELQDRLDDAIVQGRLYERILGHVHHRNVRKIAYPGLVLRRITWELIRDVLAKPCKLGRLGEKGSRALFDLLAKEIALVRRSVEADELQLRPELRRIVREDFHKDRNSAQQRTAIHRAAIAYYGKRDSIEDRAEEIYHRLALGQDTTEVDERWRNGVEQFLWDAVGELPPEGNAYLANRVGGVLDISAIEASHPIEWEEYVGKRASDLLKFGQPAKALELLSKRAERLPDSRLHYVESIARRMLPEPDMPGAEAAAERAVSAARAGANAEEIRDALEELVQVRRLRGDNVGVLRGLADLANLGDALGDDLVLLQSEVEGLEATTDVLENRTQFTHNAVRVFNRLDDDLVAKAPELSRRVAAQVGAVDAGTLQRVIRLVGTGSLDERAADGLRSVLTSWSDVDGAIESFVPDASKSPNEVANAARHLVSTRHMDSATASKFASWLSSVVTPKYGNATLLTRHVSSSSEGHDA